MRCLRQYLPYEELFIPIPSTFIFTSMNNHHRLIVASSRAPHLQAVLETVRKNVIVVQYKYDTYTLDDILAEVDNALHGMRVETIALLMHCSETELFICFTGGKVLSVETASSDVSIREFLSHLVQQFMKFSAPYCRLDFLNTCTALHVNGELIIHQLEMLLNVPVGMSKDLLGAEISTRFHMDQNSYISIGELYFDIKLLQDKLQIESSDAGERRLEGYEKIRTVGKGAFGTAVLYRKTADDALVVIKEINMIDLTVSERQMALNEVQVLSRLDHPNIISYLGSFERDGVLMIEMEYADGGTLAQMLSQRDQRLDEREILMLFRQIVAAIRYMHDNNILHRDLKTANVFLNKDNTIKVGDFGISKMMTTRGQAQTVLGTPYYISPEMCEGKQYDQKSDIWALGCILYEMACLQKTFEGSNLPALVNKIMRGHFQPVPAGYSPGFRQLIHDLLQKEPQFRPTAAEILDSRIPKLLDSLARENGGDWFLDQQGNLPVASQSSNSKSVLYELKTYETAFALTPIQLPPRSKIKEVSVSNTHMIALTTELVVYTWGEGKRGQLGHGDIETWRQHPESVESLRGKSINRIGAGDGYSVFVSDSGMVMTCGDGTFGCLGHGDWNNAVRPRLVEKLLSVDVAVVGCGPHHVAVLSGEGELYTWGRGDGGRLGLGHEEDCCSPTKIKIPGDYIPRLVRCGGDGTAIITTEGFMMACGRNSFNKLGLNDKHRGLLSMSFKGDMEKALILTRVKAIGSRIADVSLGITHTAVLTESGHVLTFGRNEEGQLGRGHLKPTSSSPSIVKFMADKVATMVQCGPTYTVVGTIENAIYFWGTRYGNFMFQDSSGHPLLNPEVSAAGLSNSKSVNKFQDQQLYGSHTGSQYTSILNVSSLCTSNQMTETLLEPQEILALYASPTQIEKGETVSLAWLYALKYSILVLVDTTVPLARLQPLPVQSEQSDAHGEEDSSSASDDSTVEGQESAQGTDYDSLGPVPEWIKAELAQSEAVWTGFSGSQNHRR